MLTTAHFTQILRGLPSFLDEGEVSLAPWRQMYRQINDIQEAYPDHVDLRLLDISPEGQPLWHLRLGHGPKHLVVDVMPHGGELFWFVGSLDYAMFLCENPELLEGRTVDLLYLSPDPAALNVERWAYRLAEGMGPTEFLALAIEGHHRDPDPLKNDPWAYPLQANGKFINQPTQGARAGMQVIQNIYDDIHDDNEELVLWVSGHNMMIGCGVQFMYTGPNEAETAPVFELLAEWLGIPLDYGRPDPHHVPKLTGTEATFRVIYGSEYHEYDPTVQCGGAAYDWARERFPNMATQITEVPMFSPVELGPFQHLTRSQAEAISRATLKTFRERMEVIAKIARKLPANNPDVSAVVAYVSARDAWGTRTEETDLQEMLHPHVAYQVRASGPLHEMRIIGPALAILDRYADAVTALDFDPVVLAESLRLAAWVISVYACNIEMLPFRQAVLLQILSAEAAFFGALGIPLDLDALSLVEA